jgi:hypothetical protein
MLDALGAYTVCKLLFVWVSLQGYAYLHER